MKKPLLSKSEIIKMFNTSADRINQQYKDNAVQMRNMAEKARKTGKKVNGATAEELDAKAAEFEKLAAQ